MRDQDAPFGDRMADGAKDAVVRFFSTLHAAAYQATDGKALNRVLGMKVVELTTTGRRTGSPRSTMLTTPLAEHDRIVLVASNGGDDRHPQWYRNILACPDVSVRLDGRLLAMHARVATDSDRSDLWRTIRSVTPTYDLYQSKTSRQLPIVVLEPSNGGG
jgi:deazaflavin-dependent oxidoreductase (nitroreductase family)